jgi:hypothetical protein
MSSIAAGTGETTASVTRPLVPAARSRLLWWILVALTAFALRLPAMQDRFYSNDEATYEALATKLLAGGVMYVDAVDHKPPGVTWLYAGVMRLAGVARIGPIRALLAALVALTGLLIGELAVMLTGESDGRIAGLLYVLVSTIGFAPNTQAANTELVLNAPLALAATAIVACTRQTRFAPASRWAFVAGIATGVAALFKYQAALAGLAWLVWVGVQKPRMHFTAGVVGLALGFAVPFVALACGFAVTGHLEPFLFWGWRYNLQYVTAVPLSHQAVRALIGTAIAAIGWLPAIALVGLAPVRMTFGWLWMAAMALAVCVGGRFFGNYYLMLTPPLALLAGAGCTAAFSSPQRAWRRSLVAMIAALALISTGAAAAWDRVVPAQHEIDERYRAAGLWIRSHSRQDDRLFVWGDSSQIYAYAQRVMGTRFAFCNYHTGITYGRTTTLGGQDVADPSQVVARAWRELLEDLHRAPPAIIADAAAAGLHGFGDHSLEHYPEIWTVIQARYRYAATVGGIRIYVSQLN